MLNSTSSFFQLTRDSFRYCVSSAIEYSASISCSSLRSILSPGTAVVSEASAWPTITSAHFIHRQAMKSSWSPVWGCANDVKPVCKSGLWVGRGSRGRRISLTVLRPVRSPLSHSTSKHPPCTTHLGSESKRPPPTHVPLHPSKPKPTRKLPPICVIPRSYRPGEFIAHFIRNTSSHYNFCDSLSPTFFTSAVTETILLYSTLPSQQLLLLTTSSIPP
ncbi:hypothetical protein FJTKL_10328 [Diaporthe vaccinii]|uniref:Uncharacterized protein n=1 Tax=Diaporthe vaccinii TaxID=105482 RepID=A0ABR4EKP2_9PEZI